MVHTSGFALEGGAVAIDSIVYRAPSPFDHTMNLSLRGFQFVFLHCGEKIVAMQRVPQNSALSSGEIKGSAVKEGIRRKNHMSASGSNSRFKPHCPFVFFRRARHIDANLGQVLTI